MASWSTFLLTYLLGGVTFIPLVLIIVLLHAYYTFPYREDVGPEPELAEDDIVQPGDDVGLLKATQKELKDDAKSKPSLHESEVAAGYFAVCREYTPMGINAKPIERSTPVGSTTVAAPSPSVYQTMYRSIFDRKQQQGPLDNKGASQRPKKAGNVFYVVLRHGHLMLFDDDDQLEVRHVISLAHHDVSIYSGGDTTPEGELFIKRNALCLSRRKDGPELGPDSQLSKPFYLFSENCSAKEDFYFALLRNQEQALGADGPAPAPLQFEVKNIISLVQKLHSSEEHLQTRWLNAMIGRIFLGIHRTADLENFIREKLTKKISRVKRPSFLSNISIRKIDTGDSAPYFTNPRLKDLTVEGECGVEADVRYTGNFRLEVAAVARIDLGSRIKAREVNLVLAVVIRKLEGHILFKIKPPPSNRIWFSFQQMPKIEMTIEPIVSQRQITYTVILRQIENRIKEVMAETLVLPFWDDVPFFRTEHKRWRGGIFTGDDGVQSSMDMETVIAQAGDVDDVDSLENGLLPSSVDLPSMEKSHSVPVIEATARTGLFGRKLGSRGSKNKKAGLSTTSVDTQGLNSPEASASTTSISVIDSPPLKPVSERSSSFINDSLPINETDVTNADIFKPSTSPPGESPAADAMARLSAHGKPGTPPAIPNGSPHRGSIVSNSSSHSSASSREATDTEKDDDQTPRSNLRRGTASSAGSVGQDDNFASQSPGLSGRGSVRSQNSTLGGRLFMRRDPSNASVSTTSTGNADTPKKTTLAAVGSAASNAAGVAKRWGWNTLQKHGGNGNKDQHHQSEAEPPLDLSKPMGGGRPLPPPGVPLPMPTKRNKVVPIAVPKRKPVPPPTLPERTQHEEERTPEIKRRPVPPPPLPARRHVQEDDSGADGDEMLVVAAPISDSEPTSPAAVEQGEYLQPWVENVEDEDEHEHEHEHEQMLNVQQELLGHGNDETPLEDGTAHGEQEVSTTPQSNEQIQADPGADGEDEYSAWVDNPGDDAHLSSTVTSEGMAH